jgi:hypothetical protein
MLSHEVHFVNTTQSKETREVNGTENSTCLLEQGFTGTRLWEVYALSYILNMCIIQKYMLLFVQSNILPFLQFSLLWDQNPPIFWSLIILYLDESMLLAGLKLPEYAQVSFRQCLHRCLLKHIWGMFKEMMSIGWDHVSELWPSVSLSFIPQMIYEYAMPR